MNTTYPAQKVEIPRQYVTLTTAAEKAAAILEESGTNTDINISSICSYLIHEAGRWCGSYASDFLYEWIIIELLAKHQEPVDKTVSRVVCFGLHENGVDHNDWIISSLASTKNGSPYVYPEHKYRRIYAVTVTQKLKREISVTLKDITHEIIRLDPADIT